MTHFHPIDTLKLGPEIAYTHTAILPELVHLDDPALNAMINLKQVRAITVHANDSIQYAKLEMQACNVHIVLVINDQNQAVGVITSEDILGAKPIKISQEENINGHQVKVKMIMQPCRQILAFSYRHTCQAKIGQIVQTMMNHRQHYALVIEEETSQTPAICGLFSLFNISRQLHMNLMDHHYLVEEQSKLKKE